MNSTLGRKQSPEHIRKRIANGLKTRAANFVPKPPRPCSVVGCASNARARDVCDMHYQRLGKYGTTELPARVVDVGAYLAKRSEDSGECRVWTGPLKLGYGVASIKGRNMPSHVAAWVHAHGPVPEGLQINHRCHNRACCNPAHLYAGTQKQNMADMREAGRANPNRGERVGNAKLTEAQVLEIRSSPEPTRVLKDRYRVSESLVRAVRRRVFWAHVQ